MHDGPSVLATNQVTEQWNNQPPLTRGLSSKILPSNFHRRNNSRLVTKSTDTDEVADSKELLLPVEKGGRQRS